MRCIVLVVLLGGWTAPAASPPRPDPKNPVDYVSWMNAGFTKGLTDNAAPLYREAFAALVSDDELAKLSRTPAATWTPAQRQQLQTWVERNEAALTKYTAATAKPRCYFELQPTGGSLIAVMLPDTKPMRDLGTLLATRARFHLDSGRTQAAADDLVTVLRAADHLTAQPMLVSYLVGLAFQTLAFDVLLDLPAAKDASPDYAAILAQIEKVAAETRSPKRQLTVEKLSLWDLAQRALRDNDGDGRFEQCAWSGEPLFEGMPPVLALDPPQTLDEIVAESDRWYGQLENTLDQSLVEARPTIAELETQVRAHKASLLGVFTPSLSRVLTVRTRALATQRGTLLVLHLHAQHAKTGQWPADLNTIVPAGKRQFGLDPFTGQPFIYRLVDGTPRLYSVGDNTTDDGGHVVWKDHKPTWDDNTGDFVFWPRPRE